MTPEQRERLKGVSNAMRHNLARFVGDGFVYCHVEDADAIDAALKRIDALEGVCDEAADDIEADMCDHAIAILRYALEGRD
jgi:hypothetical protein